LYGLVQGIVGVEVMVTDSFYYTESIPYPTGSIL